MDKAKSKENDELNERIAKQLKQKEY